PHRIEMAAQKLGLEARHKLVRQFTNAGRTVRQLIPVFSLEQLEFCDGAGGLLAEMQPQQGGRPRAEFRGQQIASSNQCSNERALTRLYLSDDRDLANLMLENAHCVPNKACARIGQLLSEFCAVADELSTDVLKRRANWL